MEAYVSIDDTDSSESRGTGHLAELIRRDIERIFGCKTARITRHQLFVSDEIPYTSHNSAMCFTADVDPGDLDNIIRYAGEFLERECAPGSDPGLCVAVADRIANRTDLINFGFEATRSVLVKHDAIVLAQGMRVHLSEHGGTGGGIIGALAGVGLRLSGNNGRFRGKQKVDGDRRPMSVETICRSFDVDEVRSVDAGALPGECVIMLEENIKTVLLDGISVLLVKPAAGGGAWVNLGKEELKRF